MQIKHSSILGDLYLGVLYGVDRILSSLVLYLGVL